MLNEAELKSRPGETVGQVKCQARARQLELIPEPTVGGGNSPISTTN